MSSGDETDGSQDFEHGDFRLDGGRGKALGDDFDRVRMREDVGSPVRVVHQRLDAADRGIVDRSNAGLGAHRLQQVQKTVKPLGRGERECESICILQCGLGDHRLQQAQKTVHCPAPVERREFESILYIAGECRKVIIQVILRKTDKRIWFGITKIAS